MPPFLSTSYPGCAEINTWLELFTFVRRLSPLSYGSSAKITSVPPAKSLLPQRLFAAYFICVATRYSINSEELMLKSLWFCTILTVIMEWTWATAYASLIDTPRISAPTCLLVLASLLFTFYRWFGMWKNRSRESSNKTQWRTARASASVYCISDWPRNGVGILTRGLWRHLSPR